jgi:hypothetical protein
MSLTWNHLVSTLGISVAVFTGCGGNTKTWNDPPGGAGSAGANAGSPSSSGGASAGTANTGGVGGSGMSQGGSGPASGGASSAGGVGQGGHGECAKADCGPQLGLPNWTCADGSVGGPTGRCLWYPSGSCGWEINNCPPAGEAGASNQGGQGNVAGSVGAGGASECSGCSGEGKVCVLQNGGPGGGRFVCATQNPCGAAAACSCIVGQGQCLPKVMGDPPGYCSCDNGLD